jgi:hypothetical protein
MKKPFTAQRTTFGAPTPNIASTVLNRMLLRALHVVITIDSTGFSNLQNSLLIGRPPSPVACRHGLIHTRHRRWSFGTGRLFPNFGPGTRDIGQFFAPEA